METIKWYSVELQLPEDGQKVIFKPNEKDNAKNLELCGIYIKSEDMFFIGFEDNGFFLYSSQVCFWKNYDNENK